jgi:hypothetical protein
MRMLLSPIVIIVFGIRSRMSRGLDAADPTTGRVPRADFGQLEERVARRPREGGDP